MRSCGRKRHCFTLAQTRASGSNRFAHPPFSHREVRNEPDIPLCGIEILVERLEQGLQVKRFFKKGKMSGFGSRLVGAGGDQHDGHRFTPRNGPHVLINIQAIQVG